MIVGAGGIGGFGVQIAAALGAAVAAIDVDRERLELAATHGAGLVLDANSPGFEGMKTAVRKFVKESGRKGIGLKIFEMSGTPAGQATAFGSAGPRRLSRCCRLHTKSHRSAPLEPDGV